MESTCGVTSRRAARSTAEALQVLVPVMEGAAAAHRLAIIPRDIKPENIFLARAPDGAVVPNYNALMIAIATAEVPRLDAVIPGFPAALAVATDALPEAPVVTPSDATIAHAPTLLEPPPAPRSRLRAALALGALAVSALGGAYALRPRPTTSAVRRAPVVTAPSAPATRSMAPASTIVPVVPVVFLAASDAGAVAPDGAVTRPARGRSRDRLRCAGRRSCLMRPPRHRPCPPRRPHPPRRPRG